MNSMYKVIGAMLIISMACGWATATLSGDFILNEQINRPNNYVYTDNAGLSGWDKMSHQMSATANTFDSISQVSLLDVPTAFSYAPRATGTETVQLNFIKDGHSADPIVGETNAFDITVGSVSNAIVPIFDAHGNLVDPNNPTVIMNPAVINERYDKMQYSTGGSAGTFDSSGNLVIDDGSRQVFSQLLSSQDDYIHVTGYDSAGCLTNPPTITSWTDVIIPGTPGTSESQAYRQFNWQDARGWTPVGGVYIGGVNQGVWNINNVFTYSMYPIEFNKDK